MQLIFFIVANLIHARIIVADFKSDSIIVNDFLFTDLQLIEVLQH